MILMAIVAGLIVEFGVIEVDQGGIHAALEWNPIEVASLGFFLPSFLFLDRVPFLFVNQLWSQFLNAPARDSSCECGEVIKWHWLMKRKNRKFMFLISFGRVIKILVNIFRQDII